MIYYKANYLEVARTSASACRWTVLGSTPVQFSATFIGLKIAVRTLLNQTCPYVPHRKRVHGDKIVPCPHILQFSDMVLRLWLPFPLPPLALHPKAS